MSSDISDPLPQTPAAAPESVEPAPCPRCQQPLVDPAGLGWCKTCGYCRSLEAERNNQLLQSREKPTRGAVLADAAQHIPLWFWNLVGGVAAIALVSASAGQFLPPGNCLPRAVWTSIQIPLGLLIIFTTQLYLVVRIAPEDEKLTFKDALMPMRLWSLVVQRLPRFATCLCLASWGAALMLFAILFVGGLRHWFSYLPGAAKTPPPVQSLRR